MTRSVRKKLLVYAAGSRWEWSLLDAGGRVLDRGEADPAAPNWPVEVPLHVLIDAQRCTGLSLDLPELAPARLGQALRWAAEEHLAGSAEDEHVVAAGRRDDGRLNCVVISNDVMAELMNRLAEQPVEVLCPDALCLPWSAGQVSLGESHGRLLVRWGHWRFGSFEPELVADLLEAEAQPGAEWTWYGGEVPATLADGRLIKGGETLLDSLVPGAMAAPINLMAGPWTPISARAAGRNWRWVAGLAAAALVLAFATAALERQLLRSDSASLQAAIDQRFTEAFPGVTPAGRHRELAERELIRLRFGGSAGLLDLMYRSAPVVSAQAGLAIDGISFRDGQLELRLRAPDVAVLDELEQRLRALNLDAAVQSASLDAQGASGRIRISEVRR